MFLKVKCSQNVINNLPLYEGNIPGIITNKMKKVRPFGLMAVILLTACQQLDKTVLDESEEHDERQVSIVASIGTQNQIEKRTTSSGGKEGKFSFSVGDNMGVFMKEGSACKWELSDVDGETKWTTENPMTWDDEQKAVTFYAYSPYVEAAEKDKVLMPDLSKQRGNLEDIGKYDFLVARNTTSYADGNGKVSFTGENAFKHVSSLLAFTIKGDSKMVGATIKKVLFKAQGIATLSDYVFKATEADSFVEALPTEDVIEELTLSLNKDVPNSGLTVYTVINQLKDTALKLSITYVRNGVTYETTEADLGSKFLSNNMYTFSLSVNKGDVIIAEPEITDWTLNELEDVIVNEK